MNNQLLVKALERERRERSRAAQDKLETLTARARSRLKKHKDEKQRELLPEQERLAILGVFSPFLVMHLEFQTCDALLSFAAWTLLFSLCNPKLQLRGRVREALSKLVASLGVRPEVLHEIGAWGLNLSPTTGQLVVRREAYRQWQKTGLPVGHPEPLNTVVSQMVFPLVDLEYCVANLGLVASVANPTSPSQTTLARRCVGLVNAVCRRLMKESISEPQLKMMNRILKRDYGNKAGVPGSTEASDNDIPEDEMEVFEQLLAEEGPELERLDKELLACRLLGYVSLLTAATALVPQWLHLSRFALPLLTLLTDPSLKERRSLDTAVGLTKLWRAVGLDAATLRALSQETHFPLDNEPEFSGFLTRCRQHLVATTWKPDTLDPSSLLLAVVTPALKEHTKGFLDGLPSRTESRESPKNENSNLVLEAESFLADFDKVYAQGSTLQKSKAKSHAGTPLKHASFRQGAAESPVVGRTPRYAKDSPRREVRSFKSLSGSPASRHERSVVSKRRERQSIGSAEQAEARLGELQSPEGVPRSLPGHARPSRGTPADPRSRKPESTLGRTREGKSNAASSKESSGLLSLEEDESDGSQESEQSSVTTARGSSSSQSGIGSVGNRKL